MRGWYPPSKNCGLGPVGFPKGRPNVAVAGGFPLRPIRVVANHGTGLPLSPHCNPWRNSIVMNSLGVFLNKTAIL